MKRVCVYLGSKSGDNPAYAETARELGAELVKRDLELVYGAGGIGLMGELARAVSDAGGIVTGVIPERLLQLEAGTQQVGEVSVVDNMHQRKARMAELADAFVVMPGGLGTLEEFFETLTWAQLGYHDKPIGMLDVGGYFQPLLGFLDHVVERGFVSREHRNLFTLHQKPEALLDDLVRRSKATDHFDARAT